MRTACAVLVFSFLFLVLLHSLSLGFHSLGVFLVFIMCLFLLVVFIFGDRVSLALKSVLELTL